MRLKRVILYQNDIPNHNNGPIFQFLKLDSDLTNGGFNANACPKGSKTLNPTECEEAAALLNFRYVSNDVWKNSPKGCLVHAGFFGIPVYFNSHPIGAPKNDEAPLCVKGTCLRL